MSHNTSLGSEQTAKLRLMVKSKLIEIGEYVDDQLTDYVMIMVTNKKSEKQMAEDLELFLGGKQQSTSFSSWLHTAINNLLNGSASSHQSSSNKKSTSNGSKQSSTSKLQSKTSVNLDSEELAIQIETNEFTDDFSEDKAAKLSSAKKKEESINKVKQQQTLKTEEEEMEQQDHSNRRPRETSPTTPATPFSSLTSISTSQKFSISSCVGAVINRKEKSDRQQDRDRTKKPEAAADEADFERSAKRKSSTLSSMIKVSDRKYPQIPKSMQPNKNILLRAVDDANNSVKPASHNGGSEFRRSSRLSSSRASKEDEEMLESSEYSSSSRSLSGRIIKSKNTDNKLELFSKHYHSDKLKKLNEENRAKQLKPSSLSSFGAQLDKSDELELEEKPSFFSDKRRVQLNENDDVALKQVDTNKREIVADSLNANEKANSSEPKFIVTLSGLDADQFLGSKKRSYSDMIQNENDDFEMGDNNGAGQGEANNKNGDMVMEAEEDAESLALKKKLVRCTFWPMCDKGDVCPYLHPNKPCTLFPNCTFGQLCHYLHPSCRYDGFCTRLDCPYTHVIKKPAPIVPNAVKLDNVGSSVHHQQQQIVMETTSVAVSAPGSSSAGPKITINKIQPMYSLHNQVTTIAAAQSEGVKAPAPRMPFQPTSFYKSPQATYRSNQFTLINRATSGASTVQINCKYGNLCKNPKCIYTHPNLPQKSQLKWTANPSSTIASSQTSNSSNSVMHTEAGDGSLNNEIGLSSSIDSQNNHNNNNQTIIMSN